ALTNIRICSCSVFISPWTGWLNTARRSPGWCRAGGGVEGSRHSRERRESGGHRHARTERPAGGRRRGRSSVEAAFRRCAARQAGNTERGRQGGGVSRLQRSTSGVQNCSRMADSHKCRRNDTMPVAKIHVLEGRYDDARLDQISKAVQQG